MLIAIPPKYVASVIEEAGELGARACIVISERNTNLYKSFRNFPRVAVRTAEELCAFDVVNGGTIIAERAAMDHLAQRVGVKDDGGAA